MNQKEATAAGLAFGTTNALRVLKRIRQHMLYSDQVTPEEWRELDAALRMLDPLGRKYEAVWNERVRSHAEEWRARRDAAA
jgi:hypothetical protein